MKCNTKRKENKSNQSKSEKGSPLSVRVYFLFLLSNPGEIISGKIEKCCECNEKEITEISNNRKTIKEKIIKEKAITEKTVKEKEIKEKAITEKQ